jgi:hypothetical protein
MYLSTTLKNRSTSTIYGKMRIMAVIHPQLTSWNYNLHIFAVSDKETTFNRCSKNEAILAIIYIDISTNIKNKIGSRFTSINVKLLTINGTLSFNVKLPLFLLKIVIIRIKYFFFYWSVCYMWFIFLLLLCMFWVFLSGLLMLLFWKLFVGWLLNIRFEMLLFILRLLFFIFLTRKFDLIM